MSLSTKPLFIVTLILGLLVYILAAHFGVTGVMLHSLPISAMLVYAGAVYVIPKAWRDVSDADNAYYMGFIFTMTSLGLALYQNETDAENNINVSKLVQSFGIALSSTIVGIFLRILLSPRRQDIDSEEDSARLALQESVHGFCNILNESTQSIKVTYESHVTGFTQSLSQASDSLVNGVDAFNFKASAVFNDMVDLLENSLPKTLNNVNESFTQLFDSVERNTAKIQNTLDVQLAAIVKTNELIKEHGNQLEVSSKSMSGALDTLTTRISNVKIDRETIESHVKSVFTVYESAAKVAASSLEQTTDSLNSIIEELADLPSKVDVYVESKNKHQNELKAEIEQSFLNISDLLNRNLVLFQNLPNSIETNIRPILKTLDDSRQNLISLQDITPAIAEAKNGIVANLDEKYSESNALISNIYSATYEILQKLNTSKQTNNIQDQEHKAPAA
jgi:hypothetical protein